MNKDTVEKVFQELDDNACESILSELRGAFAPSALVRALVQSNDPQISSKCENILERLHTFSRSSTNTIQTRRRQQKTKLPSHSLRAYEDLDLGFERAVARPSRAGDEAPLVASPVGPVGPKEASQNSTKDDASTDYATGRNDQDSEDGSGTQEEGELMGLVRESIRVQCEELGYALKKNPHAEELFNFIKTFILPVQKKVKRAKAWKYPQLCKYIEKNHGVEVLKENSALLKFKLDFVFEAYRREFQKLDTVAKSLVEKAKTFSTQIFTFGPQIDRTWQLAEKIEVLKVKLNAKLVQTILHLKDKFKGKSKDVKQEAFVEDIPDDDSQGDSPTSRSRRGKKFENTYTLKKWYHDHLDNPYPSEQEKRRLAYMCDMLPKQVSTWFGNYRMRFKAKLEALKTGKVDGRKRKRRSSGTRSQKRRRLSDPTKIKAEGEQDDSDIDEFDAEYDDLADFVAADDDAIPEDDGLDTIPMDDDEDTEGYDSIPGDDASKKNDKGKKKKKKKRRSRSELDGSMIVEDGDKKKKKTKRKKSKKGEIEGSLSRAKELKDTSLPSAKLPRKRSRRKELDDAKSSQDMDIQYIGERTDSRMDGISPSGKEKAESADDDDDGFGDEEDVRRLQQSLIDLQSGHHVPHSYRSETADMPLPLDNGAQTPIYASMMNVDNTRSQSPQFLQQLKVKGFQESITSPQPPSPLQHVIPGQDNTQGSVTGGEGAVHPLGGVIQAVPVSAPALVMLLPDPNTGMSHAPSPLLPGATDHPQMGIPVPGQSSEHTPGLSYPSASTYGQISEPTTHTPGLSPSTVVPLVSSMYGAQIEAPPATLVQQPVLQNVVPVLSPSLHLPGPTNPLLAANQSRLIVQLGKGVQRPLQTGQVSMPMTHDAPTLHEVVSGTSTAPPGAAHYVQPALVQQSPATTTTPQPLLTPQAIRPALQPTTQQTEAAPAVYLTAPPL